MKFSAQEEYGLRLLIRIARKPEGRSCTIPELAGLEGLSEPHVAKLLMIMRKANFIQSTRGQAGGYTLSRPSTEIVIGEVLAELGGRLFDEDFCARHSGLEPECVHQNDDCALYHLWDEVQTAVDNVVYKKTLQDVMDQTAGRTRVVLGEGQFKR
jgi:Rrf2 family protein